MTADEPTLLTGRTIRDMLADADRSALKRFGQNFVIDPNLVNRIVRQSAVGPTDRVVEIGPGLGSLTIPLVHTAERVVGVEIDPTLAARLSDTVSRSGAVGELTVVTDDALRGDDWYGTLARLDMAHGSPRGGWVLVANLPYNIAATLILDVLERRPLIDRLVVMVQAEAAERLAAATGTRAASGATVKLASRARAQVLMPVPAEVFYPRPRVASAVLAVERVDRGWDDGLVTRIAQLAEAGFSQRRKTIRTTLRGRVSDDAFETTGIDPSRRAETLDMDEWAALARAGDRS